MDTDLVFQNKMTIANKAFNKWKATTIDHRCALFNFLSEFLLNNINDYALFITQEMGKPITQSKAEIKKCVSLIQFYTANAAQFLADEIVETDADESFISKDPLGVILGIMPWNYPFWQVFRFAIPTLLAGNSVLLKHAENVTGCALLIEELFKKAGFPKGTFQTLLVNHNQLSKAIENPIIKGISLTASEKAGRVVAAQAGKNLKKTLLELGGSNACIILKDADLNKHINTIVNARMQNFGQSCIAAKRFIVEAPIYNEFIDKYTKKIQTLVQGDPRDADTQISCMAREDLARDLVLQVEESIALGAIDILGHYRIGTFVQPTIITEVRPGMPVFDEEVFGPVAAVMKVQSVEEAIALSNSTNFGLGVSIFTENIIEAKKMVSAIEDGAFFVNGMVKSYPQMPFGGTKNSGYGRELSKEGMLEFVNLKTVVIRK